MKRILAFLPGVLAAVSLLCGAAHPAPHPVERRGGGGAVFRAGPPARELGGFHGFRGAYPSSPPPRPAYFSGPSRAANPGDFSAPAPPSAYPQGYASPPPHRTNSLGADWREQQEEARSGVRHGQMAPLGNVISSIGRHAPGRPLDAGIEYQGSRAVYRVRWLMNNGRRVDYLVDAASGAILSEH